MSFALAEQWIQIAILGRRSVRRRASLHRSPWRPTLGWSAWWSTLWRSAWWSPSSWRCSGMSRWGSSHWMARWWSIRRTGSSSGWAAGASKSWSSAWWLTTWRRLSHRATWRSLVLFLHSFLSKHLLKLIVSDGVGRNTTGINLIN